MEPSRPGWATQATVIALSAGICAPAFVGRSENVQALPPPTHQPDLGAEWPPVAGGVWHSAAFSTASNAVWSSRIVGGTVEASMGGSVVSVIIPGAVDSDLG